MQELEGRILEHRGCGSDDVLLRKVGCDKGRGSLKVSLNLLIKGEDEEIGINSQAFLSQIE